MPHKDPDIKKAYMKAYHDKYDKEYRRKNSERYKRYDLMYNEKVRRPMCLEVKRKFIVYKGDKCSCCNNQFPDVCYDFHHLDRSTKYKEVSCMITEKYPMDKIKEEVDKCILLCSNCHRILEREIYEKVIR